MNPFEMVAAIVFIVTIGSIVRSRAGESILRRGRRAWHDATPDDGEKRRLREEVNGLKDRVAVLERIVTDRSSTLEQEIERLREPSN